MERRKMNTLLSNITLKIVPWKLSLTLAGLCLVIPASSTHFLSVWVMSAVLVILLFAFNTCLNGEFYLKLPSSRKTVFHALQIAMLLTLLPLSLVVALKESISEDAFNRAILLTGIGVIWTCVFVLCWKFTFKAVLAFLFFSCVVLSISVTILWDTKLVFLILPIAAAIYLCVLRKIDSIDLAVSSGFTMPKVIARIVGPPVKLFETVTSAKLRYYFKTAYFRVAGLFLLISAFIFFLPSDEIYLPLGITLFACPMAFTTFLQTCPILLMTVNRKTLFFLFWGPLAATVILSSLNTFNKFETVTISDMTGKGTFNWWEVVDATAIESQNRMVRQYAMQQKQKKGKVAVKKQPLKEYTRVTVVRILLVLTVMTAGMWFSTLSRRTLKSQWRLRLKKSVGSVLSLMLLIFLFLVKNTWDSRQAVRDFIWNCEAHFIWTAPLLLLFCSALVWRCLNNFKYLELNSK